jgi:hypothetical protein
MAIGNPITLTDNVASKQITIVATADQTSFAPSGGYRINQLGVYRNGVRLVDGRDFTARDGATVTLVEGASASDVVEFQIFDDFKVADAINAHEDSQTVNGDLTVSGNFTGSGTSITGETFYGDGSGLTGISTGVSINAAGGALQRVMLGNVTAGVANTLANTGSLYWNDNTSTLYATNVNISGTTTSEDTVNVDSTGIVTAGLGFRATKGGLVITAGVSTFTPYPAIDANEEVQVGASIQLGKAGIVTALGLDISTGGVDIDGLTNLDETIVAGVSTFSAKSVFNTAYPSIDADNEIQVGTAIQLGKAGVVTATTFVGNVTGDLTGDINATTLDTTTSGAVVTGIITATGGADLNGFKTEEGVYDTTALNGEFDFEFENGHVQTHTGSTAGTYFPDFRVSSSTSLDSVMGVGDVVSCTLIVAASNTAHYCTTGIKIDNSTSNVTIEWIGSSAASAGKGAGYDIYAFTIQKTAATPAYLVIVNATDAG